MKSKPRFPCEAPNHSVERDRPQAALVGSLRGFAATVALTSNVMRLVKDEVMNGKDGVLAVQDSESERPIPSAWRPVFTAIVSAFSRQDYQLSSCILGVEPVSAETADYIRKYVANYGERLTELPKQSWETSVCIWNGVAWDCLIDLWTEGEGRSDLVLSVKVSESPSGFSYSIYMVYVP